jgi:hypothetical protein
MQGARNPTSVSMREVVANHLLLLAAALLIFAAPMALADTHWAPPPGGANDTQALQRALDQCVPGGHDCKVQLRAGVYRTKQLQVSGFHGSVRGAGMEATVIEALAPLDVSQENGEATLSSGGGFRSKPPSATSPYPYVLTFVGGSDFSISDLTLSVPGSPATNGYYESQDWWADWMNGIYVEGDGRIERVGFDASAAPGVSNFSNAFLVGSGKVFEMKSSRVRASCANGFIVDTAVGTRITVDGNSFERGSAGGVFWNPDSLRVRYTHNRVTGGDCGMGIYIVQQPWAMSQPGAPSSFWIAENQLTVNAEGSNAISIDDSWVDPAWGGVKTVDAYVVDNGIQVTGGFGSGIWLRWLKDALLEGNRISGDGCVGMYVGRAATSAVIGNDLRGFTANSDCGLPSLASILLNQWSHDCFVGWNRTPNGVVDLGTHNKVIGNR